MSIDLKEKMFVNTGELCRIFNINPPTIKRWMKELGFPKPIIGGRGRKTLYDMAEVQGWITKQREERG